MPRTCTIEERLLTSRLESLQKTKNFETGLIIGSVGSKADALLHFVSTPEQESSKPGVIDANWMLEHAAQVARMLPGGVAVLGCYVFAAQAKLAKSEATLLPMLATVAKRLDASLTERQAVLVLLPSDAKKATCRALTVASPGKAQPVELKLEKAPPSLVCLAADWTVDVPLRLTPAASTPGQQRAQLATQLKPLNEALSETVATVNGVLPAGGLTVGQLPGGGGSAELPHAVALYSSSPTALPPRGEEDGAEGKAAAVRVVGVVHGRVFIAPKEDVAFALATLKRDLTASLAARVTLFFESLDEEEEEEGEGDGAAGALALEESATHALPRRAHVSVPELPFSLCDYLAADDEPSDCAERLKELVAVSMAEDGDEETLLGPEAVADTLLLAVEVVAAKSAAPAKGAAKGGGGAAASDSAAPSKSGGGMSVLIPVAALLVVAIAVGAAMLMGGGIEPDMGVVGRVRAPDEGLGAAAETLGHEAPTSAE